MTTENNDEKVKAAADAIRKAFELLQEEHIKIISNEFTKAGRPTSRETAAKLYGEYIHGIRYEFARRGFEMAYLDAVMLWDGYYLQRFKQGK